MENGIEWRVINELRFSDIHDVLIDLDENGNRIYKYFEKKVVYDKSKNTPILNLIRNKFSLAEKENLQKYLEEGKGLCFRHVSDMDENGICYFLGTNWYTKEWENPAVMNVIGVSSTRLHKRSVPPHDVVGRSVAGFICDEGNQNWVCIDFEDKYVRPTRYTLRHFSLNNHILRNWVLEGSVDMETFQILKEHNDDRKLFGRAGTATWKLDVKERYRYFRIRQCGRNSSNDSHLVLGGFEIYGEMYLYPNQFHDDMNCLNLNEDVDLEVRGFPGDFELSYVCYCSRRQKYEEEDISDDEDKKRNVYQPI